MTVFTATFSAITLTNAGASQDLMELVPDATTRLRLLEIEIMQYSDIGAATADLAAAEMEIVSILVIRGYTTAGADSATAVTPVNLNSYGRASVTTVTRNNTTLAKDGTPKTLLSTGWHLQAGFIWRPPEDLSGPDRHRRQILIAPSERVVIRMNSTLDDDVVANMTVTFEEIGKAPTS